MATSKIKVRATGSSILTNDFVLVEVEGRDKHFAFKISPKGTAVAACVETEVDDKYLAAFKAAIEAKRAVVIKQNPKYDEVKTDTDGDGVNDNGEYGWVDDINNPIYEIAT